MKHKKENLFIRLANLRTDESSLENDITSLLSLLVKETSFNKFTINQNPITFSSFRFLQRNIRFCCRTLFFLYTPQSSTPLYFPKPEYSVLKFRQMKVLNLINSRSAKVWGFKFSFPQNCCICISCEAIFHYFSISLCSIIENDSYSPNAGNWASNYVIGRSRN